MTFEEFENALEALLAIDMDPDVEPVTFFTEDRGYRGIIKRKFGINKNNAVLLIECLDWTDTSGAGYDYVTLPISKLLAMKHDAGSYRIEKQGKWGKNGWGK